VDTDSELRVRFKAMAPSLDERARRIVAASEAKAIGPGGVSRVWRATGVSRRAIYAGLKELGKSPEKYRDGSLRIRKSGAGRKLISDVDTDIVEVLDSLVEPTAKGDPETCLRWVSRSLRRLAGELNQRGHRISHVTVQSLLENMGYSLQGNSKDVEGKNHPDRDAQFHFINKQVKIAIKESIPAISVDTKKKELIGNFRAPGKEWRPIEEPEKVLVHDFIIPELGKVSPYGIYDIAHNSGWVSLGVTSDTAAFAVATIRRWWKMLGRKQYGKPSKLLIMADRGGSNGYLVRLWKVELQKFVNHTGIPVQVCHFPPGTSKWNRIEHRLFSFISKNWRGHPLITHAVMLNLIAATTTSTGLKVRCELDPELYLTGIKISKEEMACVNLVPDAFHGEWNYTILPH
jgi:hypothetical protein